VRGHGGAVGSGTGMEEDYESHASTKTSPSKTRSKRLSPIRVRNSQVSLLVEASKCPADFDKLEGISLLGSGNKEEAIMKLERYRSYLEGEEQDRRLMLSQRGNEKEQEERNRQSARVWGEISGIYSACGNFKAAQLMAGKALELDSSLTTAQKTLVLAVGRTGESSFREEDWIFSFFASAKTVQMEEAASFYAKRTEKFPKNGFFWYGYAMLNFVVVRDYDQSSEPLFEKALELLPEEGRISEAYATYLFQTRSAQIMRIKELYEVSMQLDASNLVLRANSAAFLLFLRSAQLSRLEEGSIQYGDCEAQEVYVVKEENLVGEKREEVMEGFDEAQNFLESALFSVSLVDQHPQVYLECWFYVLCYTIERDRAIQALQYIKAALRKGIRARNWDMHMHIRFLRRNRLFDDNNTHWIPKLALVIADRHPFDILDDWKLWCSLKSDKLVLNLKLAPHSFRVCVSPSKRRDKKEEFSPPSFFKTKSAPLASMASSNHRLNSPTLNRSKARPKQTASSPFNAKSRTNRKLVSVSSVSPSTPETAATHDEAAKPNGLPAKATTTGPILRKAVSELTQPKISPMAASIDSRKISTTSVSKSTPTRTMKAEDEDDILNLLSTHSSTLSTPPASEPSSSIMAPAENVRRTNSRVASAGEKAPKRQTSGLTSSAGSVLFSESTAIPAAIRKTKSPPLSAPSVRNVAKTSTSRNTRSRASSPSVENTSMDVTPNEQVWERLMDKYKEEDDILNSLETSSSSKTTRSSRSPTQRNAPDTIPRPNSTSPTANFSEAVPKRPTRSASGTLPVPKRTKRV
jgi:tetratricopeptide (TPR) repeat protein